MTYNSEHDRLILACSYADQIEIFDFVTKEVKIISSPSGPKPSYIIVSDYGGTLAHKDDEVECYYDVRTVGDYIIAQYDGRLIGDSKLRASTEYRVFSVEGHYITRFCVEGHARSFDLSKDGQMMYVAMQDGIYFFEIL